MSLLQWEINWVLSNQHLYEGPMHAQAVVGNIQKRYQLAHQQKVVTKWATTCYMRDELIVKETFNVASIKTIWDKK